MTLPKRPAERPASKSFSDAHPRRLQERLYELLRSIYPGHDAGQLTQDVIAAFWGGGQKPRKRGRTFANSIWSEKDTYLITYGNSLIDGDKPLEVLYQFLSTHLHGTFNGVHILPYFPYSSDDGFAVIDYAAVNEALGDWEDIERIGNSFHLMSDLVLNHGSSQSDWFKAYLAGEAPYDKFYFEAQPGDDISQVVRPRAHPLLHEVKTQNGPRNVWCTFSHDQVDFNFANPEVLLAFLRIMQLHLAKGVRTIRLDAVAFLWKEPGTPCIHLRQTHEIIRLMRVLADYHDAPITLITETNVPNVENLSYFGNRNEAHVIYNFSLPPLIVHGLLNGTSKALNAWQMAMPPAQMGCAYFNFTASHDGIGLRGAESLIPDEEIDLMINAIKGFGGKISMRQGADGTMKPYEMNISLFEAMKGTINGEDKWQIERFLCSQAIAMALEGIPAIYIHSLLATPNDYEAAERTGHNRTINRKNWSYPELKKLLSDEASPQAKVFNALTAMIKIRSDQPAFHPNATQFTLQLGEQLFGFWRQSLDRAQSIFALHNMSDTPVALSAMSLNLIGGDNWVDLLSREDIIEFSGDIHFTPYQCRWITNKQ